MERPRTVFMLVKTSQRWLALSPAERGDFVQRVLRPILARHRHVRLRYFDAEAYCAAITDVLMWESADDEDYRGLIEELRETPFWGSFFEIRELVPCIEDDFARHYGVEGFAARQPRANDAQRGVDSAPPSGKQ